MFTNVHSHGGSAGAEVRQVHSSTREETRAGPESGRCVAGKGRCGRASCSSGRISHKKGVVGQQNPPSAGERMRSKREPARRDGFRPANGWFGWKRTLADSRCGRLINIPPLMREASVKRRHQQQVENRRADKPAKDHKRHRMLDLMSRQVPAKHERHRASAAHDAVIRIGTSRSSAPRRIMAEPNARLRWFQGGGSG